MFIYLLAIIYESWLNILPPLHTHTLTVVTFIWLLYDIIIIIRWIKPHVCVKEMLAWCYHSLCRANFHFSVIKINNNVPPKIATLSIFSMARIDHRTYAYLYAHFIIWSI